MQVVLCFYGYDREDMTPRHVEAGVHEALYLSFFPRGAARSRAPAKCYTTYMKQLIIIPGLGDRGWLYCFAVPLWRLLGFRARIFTFGWNGHGSYEEKFRRLQTYVAQADSPIYIIGASAGGTAAVNALALEPEKVARVVTVATPYDEIPALGNASLRDSIAATKANLRRMDSKTRGRVVSAYGKRDATVPVRKSHAPGIAGKQLNVAGHALTIVSALTVCSFVVRAELLSGRTSESAANTASP